MTIQAKNPNGNELLYTPPIVVNHLPVDPNKRHYGVSYKFTDDFGSFRASTSENGAFTWAHRKDMRKIFTGLTKQKAPQKWNELLHGFANFGYTVTEHKPNCKGSSYLVY